MGGGGLELHFIRGRQTRDLGGKRFRNIVFCKEESEREELRLNSGGDIKTIPWSAAFENAWVICLGITGSMGQVSGGRGGGDSKEISVILWRTRQKRTRGEIGTEC